MRFIFAILATALLSTASLAQEEVDSLSTASISPADNTCSVDSELNLQNFKDFTGSLPPAKASPSTANDGPLPLRPAQ